MNVRWNGKPRELPERETVAAALRSLAVPVAHVAVAVNLAFVPRSRHETTELREGDEVEVLSPQQGG